MPKVCLFCGDPFTGQKTNFEHIIPKWLVTHADLKKRTMPVKLPTGTINASLARIGMKVCQSCNEDHSSLEARAKNAFVGIVESGSISGQDAESLLDWVDKTRIALWLWMIQLYNGHHNIDPKFRVKQRIARKDRLCLIQLHDGDERLKGLAFWGLSPHFMSVPSTFGFLANGLAIVSCSSDYIVARQQRALKIKRSLPKGQVAELHEGAEASAFTRPLRLLSSSTVISQMILPIEIADSFSGVTFQATNDVDLRKSLVSVDGVQTSSSEIHQIKQHSGRAVSPNIATIQLDLSELRSHICDDFSSLEIADDDQAAIRDRIVHEGRDEVDWLRVKAKNDYYRATGLLI